MLDETEARAIVSSTLVHAVIHASAALPLILAAVLRLRGFRLLGRSYREDIFFCHGQFNVSQAKSDSQL